MYYGGGGSHRAKVKPKNNCQKKATTMDFFIGSDHSSLLPFFHLLHTRRDTDVRCTRRRKEGGSNEGAGFSDSLRKTHRLATDVWLVGALHGKQASAGESELSFLIFFSSTTALRFASFLHKTTEPRDCRREATSHQ
jgi:hypothetical protein